MCVQLCSVRYCACCVHVSLCACEYMCVFHSFMRVRCVHARASACASLFTYLVRLCIIVCCPLHTKYSLPLSDSATGRTSGEHVMILAKVILGHSYIAKQGNNKMVRPPCVHQCIGKCEHSKNEFYDSVMGTHRAPDRRLLFREFIIFEETQCCPAYLITYMREIR